jgi:Flp pilus assembly protein CpaB
VPSVQDALATRRGTIAVGLAAAALALILIFAYVHGYQRSVNDGKASVTVLIAKHLIPKGTPGATIAVSQAFQTTRLRHDQVRDGAFVDPGALRGLIATGDIYPGQQLVRSDFGTASGQLVADISIAHRAIAIPLDTAHGLIGDVQPLDRVDVLAGFSVRPVDRYGNPVGSGEARPLMRLLAENLVVLRVPSSSGGGIGADSSKRIVVQAPTKIAEEIAFAVDNGQVWVLLRPASGARPSYDRVISLETTLLHLDPKVIVRSFGGQR